MNVNAVPTAKRNAIAVCLIIRPSAPALAGLCLCILDGFITHYLQHPYTHAHICVCVGVCIAHYYNFQMTFAVHNKLFLARF